MTFRLCWLLACALVITACNFNLPESTPTVEGPEQPVNPLPDQITVTATISPTAALSPTVQQLLLETATPTGTAAPATFTATPTETPPPYEHTVRAGEYLFAIVALYGYRSPEILNEVVRVNNLSNAGDIREGQVLLIPRQTATPTPQGYEMTAAINATMGITPLLSSASYAETDCYTVQEGDSIVTISIRYNTTIEVLRDLNTQLIFPETCDYNIPSGGPGCNVLIVIGQCVNVPLPTPTPTLSPTPSGSETATPTPTYPPPQKISPPEGATVRGIITLEWVGLRVLKSDEVYVVEVVDTTGNIPPFQSSTRENALELPEGLIPSDGQTHTFEWRVFIASPGEGGVYRRVSDSGAARVFQWMSR
jgi:LysM repeat protein